MPKNGRYQIVKRNIKYDETFEVVNGRTPEGWYLNELISMGYSVYKIDEDPVVAEPEKKKNG